MASATDDPNPVQITSAPARGQIVQHEGKTYTTIQEGKAYILVPPNARTSVDPQAKSKANAGELLSNTWNLVFMAYENLTVR